MMRNLATLLEDLGLRDVMIACNFRCQQSFHALPLLSQLR
jgi:hypothetical protein